MARPVSKVESKGVRGSQEGPNAAGIRPPYFNCWWRKDMGSEAQASCTRKGQTCLISRPRGPEMGQPDAPRSNQTHACGAVLSPGWALVLEGQPGQWMTPTDGSVILVSKVCVTPGCQNGADMLILEILTHVRHRTISGF